MAPFASKATSRHSGIRWMSSTRCPTCQLNAGALRWRWKQRARSNTIMLLPERAGKAVNAWHKYFTICPHDFSIFSGCKSQEFANANAWCVFTFRTHMSKLLSQPCSGVPPPKECSKEIHGTVAKWQPGSVFLDMVCRCCGSGSPSSPIRKALQKGYVSGSVSGSMFLLK